MGSSGKRRPGGWVVAVVLCSAGVPASSLSAASEAPVTGDAIVVGSIGDASRLLPILVSDSASGDIAGLLYNGLLKYDESLNVVGDLAESWSVSEDGLTLTFRLRPNVRWHDGHPLTADDVRFTYERLIDPSVPTPFSGDYKVVQSFEVLDPLTVRITYPEPFAPALESWMMGIMPKHLLEGQDLATSPLLRHPVGHGPYRFKRWKTGELIELTANPDYFEHRPHIDRYLYRIIPDQATMFLELLAGGVDLMSVTPLQDARQTRTPYLQQAYRKFRYPSFGFSYVAYNLDDIRFKDVRVRHALNAAIDKRAILHGVLYGRGAVATGPYPPESWAYNPDVAPAPYDPGRARTLLREAGWLDRDGDGFVDRDGHPFRFTLITNQGNEVRRQAAELIQQQLKAVGIDVRIRILEWSTFIHDYVDTRRFEAVLLAWSLSRDPDLHDLFHSSKTKPGEYNFMGYANPEVDRLLVAGRKTFDRQERTRIYRELHARLYEDQPYTFLYVADALPVISSRFRNVRATAAGIGYNLIDWYAPKAEQRYRALMAQE